MVNNSNESEIFNELAISDLIRLGYTYAIFIFIAIILVKFQVLAYPHVFLMTVLYIFLTFGAEMLWLYGFTMRLRTDVGKDYESRDLFHKILNNILPFSILVFGYAILLDAFRLDHFASDGQHIEFYIRGITGLIFLIAYVYLFYKLIKQIDSAKNNMSEPPSDSWTDDYPDNKSTKYDNVLDILYNLFQPLSIIIISGIMYFIIRTTNVSVINNINKLAPNMSTV
uniref:Uncharacterized protein n=1 Tax=viral metagenome TaxID=1070528 RepID=A0A6C0C5C7_9ZZZZ